MSHLSLSPKILSSLLAFLIFSLFSCSTFAEIYLSTELKKGLPVPQKTNEFSCTDKIYGVVVDQWPAGSNHLMEAYWTDPQGKQREHTRYNFTARKGKTHTWAWLLLHRAETDILDRLLMQENDSLREFNGQWQVDFYIDGKSMGKLTFQLICG
ncbi:MAG TPA: hypothetical protein ENI67_01990 [Gammaproteobacteria bacterium]|nr:hypothetical protein [Gammaproteobacteria bacterium]